MSILLSFEHLRQTNFKRCIVDMNHPIHSWSVAEWTNAMAGEAGEACNVAKKLIRIRDGLSEFNDKTFEALTQQLADEVADTVIYADLVLASQNQNLSEAIIRKFNTDSRKRGIATLL